jgi:hypothetical protein
VLATSFSPRKRIDSTDPDRVVTLDVMFDVNDHLPTSLASSTHALSQSSEYHHTGSTFDSSHQVNRNHTSALHISTTTGQQSYNTRSSTTHNLSQQRSEYPHKHSYQTNTISNATNVSLRDTSSHKPTSNGYNIDTSRSSSNTVPDGNFAGAKWLQVVGWMLTIVLFTFNVLFIIEVAY